MQSNPENPMSKYTDFMLNYRTINTGIGGLLEVLEWPINTLTLKVLEFSTYEHDQSGKELEHPKSISLNWIMKKHGSAPQHPVVGR